MKTQQPKKPLPNMKPKNLFFHSFLHQKMLREEEEKKVGLVTSVSWLTVLGVGSGRAF
jgi:hypothetical protein